MCYWTDRWASWRLDLAHRLHLPWETRQEEERGVLVALEEVGRPWWGFWVPRKLDTG